MSPGRTCWSRKLRPEQNSVKWLRREGRDAQISFPDLGVKSDSVDQGPKMDVDDDSNYFLKIGPSDDDRSPLLVRRKW